MKPEFWYPVKPYVVTQKWGVPDEIYRQFGFGLHNGVDVALGADSKVYAPFDCQVVKNGFQPNGGGIYCGVISINEYTFPDGVTCKVLVDSLHLKQILVTEGQTLQCGDVIAIADNTGFSTGPHTHFQFRRVSWDGKVITTLDTNDANNSFDQTPYFNGHFAVEAPLMRAEVSTAAKIILLLKLALGIK